MRSARSRADGEPPGAGPTAMVAVTLQGLGVDDGDAFADPVGHVATTSSARVTAGTGRRGRRR
jgi:hypothetical protein